MALSTVAAIAAFNPLQAINAPTMRASVPAMALESELGATGPLLPYWDPLGLVRLPFFAAVLR